MTGVSNGGGGALVLAPVSIGELIDKITILEIKVQRAPDAATREIVMKELVLLSAIARDVAGAAGVEALRRELKAINESLWEVEDLLRLAERKQDFGPQFVALARTVYQTNDRRAQAKRAINLACGSSILEVKIHPDYQGEPFRS